MSQCASWAQLFSVGSLECSSAPSFTLLLIRHTCSTAHNQVNCWHLVIPLLKPLLPSLSLPVNHFTFIQDLPALYFGVFACCRPCLFLTHSSRQIPGKSLSLLIMSFVSASRGFCLPAPMAIWHFPASMLLWVSCLLNYLCLTSVWTSPAIFWMSFPVVFFLFVLFFC